MAQKTITLTRRRDGGETFSPDLPKPVRTNSDHVTISYKTLKDNIRIVSNFLYGEDDADVHNANEVGEDTFNYVLEKAKK